MRSPLLPATVRRVRVVTTLVLGLAALTLASLTGLALAKSSPTLQTAKVKVAGKTQTIVVGSHGATVYTLSGETTHNLKCTTSLCFKFWPPVKVKSAHAKLVKGKGVKGKLGIRHRSGFFQVTLGGHPLYNFMPDGGKKGSALGEGIKSFGGTWHVVK